MSMWNYSLPTLLNPVSLGNTADTSCTVRGKDEWIQNYKNNDGDYSKINMKILKQFITIVTNFRTTNEKNGKIYVDL